MRSAFFSFFYGAFFIVACGLIIGGFIVHPATLTEDGYNLKTFLFFMGGTFLLFPALVIGTIYYFIRRGKGRLHHLLRHGRNGKATILSAERTGLLTNQVPQFLFQLRITTDFGETYDLRHKQLYDELILGPVPVGKDVPVYIDAKNRENVLVMWEDLNPSPKG